MLIDSHDKSVDELVWNLFRYVMKRIGPTPTLIEWDANVPAWPELQAEATLAEILMDLFNEEERRYSALG